jgi:RsiW-degrading membrane proteinase PrsW (M82 family)
MTVTASPRQPVPAGVGQDTGARGVLLLSVLLSVLFGMWLLIDRLRPDPMGANVSFTQSYDTGFQVQVWAVLASWPVAFVTGIALAVRAPDSRAADARQRSTHRARLTVAGILILPFTITPIYLLASYLQFTLVCLVSTAFALWLTYRMQRHRRAFVRLLLVAFGWGALIGTGMGAGMNDLYRNFAPAFTVQPVLRDIMLLSDNTRLRDGSAVQEVLDAQQLVMSGLAVNAAIFEELAKGIGIAVLYLLGRRWFDGVVSGIVLGAAVGLGFNLVESVWYMTSGAPEYQFWARQSLGLMAAHTAFSAIVGASFGIARQLADTRRRRTVIGMGFLIGIGAHFLSDAALPFLSDRGQRWFTPSPALDAVVLTPLALILVQGPFVLIYVLLLRRGLRNQASALAYEFGQEARSPARAVTTAEIPILLSPIRRFKLKILAARRHGGLAAYRYVGRLHAAQLELGMQRWHRSRHEVDHRSPDEQTLRERVLALKRNPPQSWSSTTVETPS